MPQSPWHLDINCQTQRLTLLHRDNAVCAYPISSAKNGLGEQNGSEQTPRGRHIVRAKIGAHQPINSVFIGRRPTGEIYTPELEAQYPERDWILSRILWLSGCEPGRNRLGAVDTMRRYIYIHGAPDDTVSGSPLSHGCIRMKNKDIIELFEQVPVLTTVLIHDGSSA